jgi:hypothetical protein
MKQAYRFPLLGWFVAWVAAGCYSYAPIESPQPGMEVRAQLKTEAAVRRSEGLDNPIMRYEGVVVDVASDAIALNVLIARSTSAFQDVVIRDTVRLQTTEIQSLMQRKISPAKSVLVTVGVGAAAVAVVMAVDAVVGGTDDPGNGGDPTLRIPLFSLTASRLISALVGGR